MSLFVRHIPNWEELRKSGHVVRRKGYSGEFVRSALVVKIIKNAYKCGERVHKPSDFLGSAYISQSQYEDFYNWYIRNENSSQVNEGYMSFSIDKSRCDLSDSAIKILEDEREDGE